MEKKAMKIKQSNCHAFTLIELLIVVAIIAILAAIAVPNFLEAQTRAKVSRFRGDGRALATAMESYFVDYNTYGEDASYIYLQLTSPVPYISEVPTDPFGAYYNMSGILSRARYEIGTGHTAVAQIAPPRKNVYIIVGAGPDHGDSSGSISAFPWPPDSGPKFMPYDPTNGTVSWGDLYRLGGSLAELPQSHAHLAHLQ
jgi:prepilin-type N-terminal cleavage/methylation domain-containing protein